MLQMIPYGIAAVVGGLVGKQAVPVFVGLEKSLKQVTSTPAVQLLRSAIVEEPPVVLATEEIPLDNRFGNKILVSEHEFVRTATISLTVVQDNNLVRGLRGSWLPILESLAQKEVKKTLGVELNSQITRRVKVVFSTEPGYLVRYRVVWKQDSRRGLLEVGVGGETYVVPYLVTFGLSHAIESIAGEVRGGQELLANQSGGI